MIEAERVSHQQPRIELRRSEAAAAKRARQIAAHGTDRGARNERRRLLQDLQGLPIPWARPVGRCSEPAVAPLRGNPFAGPGERPANPIFLGPPLDKSKPTIRSDSEGVAVELAAENLRLTLLRYQAGESTILELVDAQTLQIQSRNSYDDGLVRYRMALANLQTLTGAF